MSEEQLELLNKKQNEINDLESHINLVKMYIKKNQAVIQGEEEKFEIIENPPLKVKKHGGYESDTISLIGKYMMVHPKEFMILYLKKAEYYLERLKVEMSSIEAIGI